MGDKIIAAYSMADMEEHYAEFGRGKDKKRRKSRAGKYAAIGAAGAAGAGAVGAGVRYGKAALSGISENKKLLDAFGKKPGQEGTLSNVQAAALGARTKLGRDLEPVKRTAIKAGNWLGNPINKAKAGYQSSDISAAAGRSQNAKIRSTGSLGNKLRQTGNAIKNVAGTRAGKIGAGLALAGALGGAGYGAYRAMKGKKKK